MSFEINPVLAGKFDVADNTPASSYASATNIQTSTASNVNDVSGPDPRRYTKFDHSDTEYEISRTCSTPCYSACVGHTADVVNRYDSSSS